ncbi:MAG: hypothetical protein EPO36_02180 [Chloroflexota bacterium]|nr:MAG: hypothetical protein EPO36_02180 [Chloroflexota bacterium]
MRGVTAVGVGERAAAAKAEVQVVGVVADDAAGDRLLAGLAGQRVGHAAVLREPPRDLETADLDLALRYLPDIKVIVTVGVAPTIVRVASDHAEWLGARLVVVETPERRGEAPVVGEPPQIEEIAEGAIVLEAPASDPDGTFAGFVGALAARLDAGATPADAWAATTHDLAVDPL